MADKAQPTDAAPSVEEHEAAPPAPTPPRRSPGHRGQDVRDTMAEMAARAQEISLEAGSKMASAMKDVINAAAGLAGFAVESARDLVQYMVRRGQMTQEEADKLIRDAEEAYAKRKPASGNGDSTTASGRGEASRAEAAKPSEPKKKPAPAKEPAATATVAPAAAKSAPAKAEAKAEARPAAKSAAKAPAAKAPAKSAAKAPAKSATKSSATAKKGAGKKK